MTQGKSGKIGWQRVALALAFVIFLAVIVWRWQSDRRSAAEPIDPSGSVTTAGGDPFSTLEARIRKDPRDGKAWMQLGGALFDTGQFAAAVGAFRHAAELEPPTARLWSSLGEARIMASEHDPMPVEAVADFEKAIALDPKDPRARYFLAVKRDLSGDHAGAIDDWLALLADTQPGAVWEADLRRTIEQVGKINDIAVEERLLAVRQPPSTRSALQTIPGPSSEDLRRAAALRPSEQRDMAEAMVARLEARLREDPANVEGWIMLMRSQVALERPEKAAQALAQAVRANPEKAKALRDQAGQLGIR